jgi:uncharacterized repeat protein (TIGR04076 family)
MPPSTKVDLVIRVKEIKGHCPVYEVGDSFTLRDGYQLVSEIPVCMNAIASLLPHYHALRISEPGLWGLAGRDAPDKAYFQCLDPHEYTGGGTVIFEVSRREPSGGEQPSR